IGATPELLLEKRGGHVVSHPLAGSARRHRDTEEDRKAGAGLLASDKDRREHAMVVESILDILAPYCIDLSTPEGTCLRATASMWHLGTRIVGQLRDASWSSAHFAGLLHPTPAVCGLPRNLANEQIVKLEPYDREFWRAAWPMMALRLGEDRARSLGINITRLRLMALLRVSLMTSTAIAFVGTIGFVGLAGPHIARLAIGEDHRLLLPASALTGAAIMSLASVASKTIIPGVLLPIGIVTAMVGLPVFFSLIFSRRRTV
ncbi:iron chelate uptake ABC transporter family permease subunit, partial [Bradyrhizobium nitroreducens]|uniref:iron chelate uptake ABC transporter family permease subunit n=1 Tax=Bradyrhizobium nitroreducens TaxID=709803 RepID=UPI001AEFB68E